MEGASADSLRLHQIAFQGRIIAAATHEFANHFAVIKEYNGLIADLLRARKPGKDALKRCVEITGSINQRSNQAAELADSLSRFAHRGDTEFGTFDAAEVAGDLTDLLQRDAGQRRIALSAVRQGVQAPVRNDPSLFQYLLFTLLETWLESLGEGGKIVLSTGPGEAGAAVVELAAESGAALEQGWLEAQSDSRLCAERLGASLRHESEGSRQRVIVNLPPLR